VILDANIRNTVSRSLDARFDYYLSQAEHICNLFMAHNDEVFGIREAAMSIVGRLGTYNHAYVMPSVRKLWITLLAELGYASESRQRDKYAKLLVLSSKTDEPFVSNLF
jgi:FKBP12-rapamycin complex-associated protein